ncbi:amidohydrolase family protein [Actinomycetospora sp. OC33-EN08]|uniref:Amidohydrolase family protein n=1 Tax=Actinomycetospora aurantiaca TaxID=3129233 RepID=A0ABU8MJQ4_9PSEU
MRKLITLEEHLAVPEVAEAWTDAPTSQRDRDDVAMMMESRGDALLEWGERRLAAMDDQGVDVQVLSLTAPGVQNLDVERAVPLAARANDTIAAAVAAHPDRFDGFATLPTPDPQAAAVELRRAVVDLGLAGAMVHGRTGPVRLDDPRNEPIWAAAAELGAPIYVHPQQPVDEVRDVYYSGFDPATDAALASAGIGWHYETGMQVLRLVLSGAFDRHPDLQLVVGHWGEVVLFYLDRISDVSPRFGTGLRRPVADYFRENISYTGSGMTVPRLLRWTIEMVGVERILSATDYPFIDNSGGAARRFLDEAQLTDAEKDAIGSGNWERLRPAR